MPFPQLYAEEVHKNCLRYANWFPGAKIALGDVGRLDNKLFTRITSLSRLGVHFGVINDAEPIEFKFTSEGVTEAAGGANANAGAGALGSASVNVSFSKKGGIYFSLSDCYEHAIADLQKLGDEMVERTLDHTWEVDNVIVVRTVTAGSATILQADTGGASISLNGHAPLCGGLAGASASAGMKYEKALGLAIVAKKKITPLFGLARVKYTFFRRPKFDHSIALRSTNPRRLGSNASRFLNVNYAPAKKPSGSHLLNFRLPRKGNYVDVKPFLDFTASTCLPDSSYSSADSAFAFDPFVGPAHIPSQRIKDVIGQLDAIDVAEPKDNDDYLHINVALPRCGKGVSLEPLVHFAAAASQPPPGSAVASAALSFEEIP